MTTELGKYHFFPWLRRGIGAAVPNADVDPLPVRATLDVELSVDATLKGVVTTVNPPVTKVKVYGPGDIIGIDPNIVIRTEPRPFTSNYEPNYLAGIEFDTPDFPWLFTPAAAQGDRLRPWLALIVLKGDEFKEPAQQTSPLPSIGLTKSSALQNLAEGWCWAHVQVSSESPVIDILRSDPGHAISRLLCPRRLDPETSYNAFLVPAFENGRKIGIGLDVSEEATSAPAWTSTTPATDSAPYPMPYYYRFAFHTSDEGDFESLVRRLQPVDLPPNVGQRPIAVDQPGPHIPSAGTPLELQGALIRVGTKPSPWNDPERTSFQTSLQTFVNLTTSTTDDPAHPNPDDPRIVPPIYGRWHAGIDRVDRAGTGWLDVLNLDPRWRTPAGFGTEVIHKKRTSLLASAWEQYSGLVAANRLLRFAQLARATMIQVYTSQLVPAAATTLLQWTAPVHSRVMGSPKTILGLVRRSPIPERMLGGAFRGITRPLGPIRRRQGAPPQDAGNLITGVNNGTLEIVPPAKPPAGTVSIDQVSDQLLPSFLKGINLPLWLLLLIAILIALAIILVIAAVAGIAVALLVLVVALTAIVAAGTTIQSDLGKVLAGETLRFSNLTPEAVADLPRRPGFTVSLPGQPAQPPGAVGTADSPEGAAFRAALNDLTGILQVVQAVDPVYEPLPLKPIRLTLLERLDPRTTVPQRTLSMIDISRALWDPPDPITPIMAAPDFPQPMYIPLRDLSQEYLLPGVEFIPPNTVGLLQANHAFIEAYMVGLNHEMARQLLVNAYPTDQRGSYFRQFWDPRGYVPRPGDPTGKALVEQLKDIPPVHTWRTAKPLGTNENRKDIVKNNLVLVVRGELLKRYPNTIIFAGKAMIDPRDGKLRLDETAGAEAHYEHPIFGATLTPDITFFGFNLTFEEALGRTAGSPLGYFFGFQQVPTEPRFGLEPIQALSPVPYWNDLSWQNFATSGTGGGAATHAAMVTGTAALVRPPEFVAGYTMNRLSASMMRYMTMSMTPPDFIPANEQPTNVAIKAGDNEADVLDKNVGWGKDSAQAAYILLRRPFRIMVHASRMLTHV